MRASCCICSDVLDEVHSISATSCGHVYHSKCLIEWIGQRKTCPICRTRVNVASILKLYFDFPTRPADKSSILENEVSNLKACLSAKDIELEAFRKERDRMKAFVRETQKFATDMELALYENLSEIVALHLKESKILKLEKMNEALINDLQMLNNVQSIIHGTQEDAECIIQECGNGSESSRQMATYCTVLKRKLQKVMDSKNKLLEINSDLKRENCCFASKIKFYEDAMAGSSRNDSSRHEKFSKPLKKKKLASYSRSDELNNSPAPNTRASSSGKISIQSNTDIPPLSVPFNKSKLSMCIRASSSTSLKAETNTEIEKYSSISPATIGKQRDDGSFLRNGLGGHSNFVNGSSGIKKRRGLKRKI